MAKDRLYKWFTWNTGIELVSQRYTNDADQIGLGVMVQIKTNTYNKHWNTPSKHTEFSNVTGNIDNSFRVFTLFH